MPDALPQLLIIACEPWAFTASGLVRLLDKANTPSHNAPRLLLILRFKTFSGH
jgi:hypothetical protein